MKGHRLAKCDGTGLDLATVFWVLKVMNLEDHIEFLCPLFEQVNWGREIPSVSNLTNSDLISAGRGTCRWESWVVLRHTIADSPGTCHDSGAPWKGSKALSFKQLQPNQRWGKETAAPTQLGLLPKWLHSNPVCILGIWFKNFMAARHSNVFKTCAWEFTWCIHQIFHPCQFTEVWWLLKILDTSYKGSFKRSLLHTHSPPPHNLGLPPALVPAMGQPVVQESCKNRHPDVDRDEAHELPMDPRDQTGGNRVHLKSLSSLLTQWLLPGPFRLTLHSHSTWAMHVLCSFCWFN